MKLSHEFAAFEELCGVAPPAGAWIETTDEWWVNVTALVAPPAGAWIETPRAM